MKVTVQNIGWLPIPWLEIHEALPVQLIAPPFQRRVISLGPHERRKLSYTLNCRRRGYFPIGPLTMQTGDLLGIERREVARDVDRFQVVLPPRSTALYYTGEAVRLAELDT